MSQWGKSQVPQILIRSVQIVEKHVQLGSRLLLMVSVQVCKCDPQKEHLRSYNDVTRSMDVFARNF